MKKTNTPIKDIYEDFESLKKFNVGFDIQKKILKELLEATPCPWKVVGITPSALNAFKKENFNKTNRIKIQRAHIENRDEWYGVLLNTDWKGCYKKWYHYILEKDKTILALSSENKIIKNINPIIFFENEKLCLFKSTRISWEHKQNEKELLANLYEDNLHLFLP
jgi:hypothetical protein